MASMLYKLAMVFKKNSFCHLLHENSTCACNSIQRLRGFLDPLTMNEASSFTKSSMHVRSMDMSIIQNIDLRNALKHGLNHIPLKPFNIAEAIAIILDAYDQMVEILDLISLKFPVKEARSQLQSICLEQLENASKCNRFGFRNSDSFLFKIPSVINEINWVLSHLYCSGHDKASNNASFICIRHIRLQALERLMGLDFLPCKTESMWNLPTSILDQVTRDLIQLLLECPIPHQSLPYLMAMYKIHKAKYRWLTNAYATLFSNIATLLSITPSLILEAFKEYARMMEQCYDNFLQIKTSMFWIINSSVEATLNFPDNMKDIFVADITRCYESIPLEGKDNLLEAIKYVTKQAYKHTRREHSKVVTSLWVRLSRDGTPVAAKWATALPGNGNWFHIPLHRIINLHAWLMKNYYVTLGDRVWLQRSGIPMGFPCSPIWCNMYLLAFKAKFIMRLVKLGRKDLLSKFQIAYRYIDDLCLINVQNPCDFLSPQQS